MTPRHSFRIKSLLLIGQMGLFLFTSWLKADNGGINEKVFPVLKTYCDTCHGTEDGKGGFSLQALSQEGFARDANQWEQVLVVLKTGQMPPKDASQPKRTERSEAVAVIDSELRKVDLPARVRRLTNFEYQNTMRDLLGIKLNLSDNLPEDPIKPYHFNNSAEYMLIGPEQMERYKENARRAMASAIVDPGEPEIHRTQREWKPDRLEEIGVYKGPGVHELAIGLKSWPSTGEFRIRVKAAAILPAGYTEVPLRLVMGSQLRHDAGTGNYVSVGTVTLSNGTDDFQEFEFRGRISNHPIQAGQVTANGQQPPRMYLYAQNLFDNGELNDHRKSAFDASWTQDTPRVVLQSIEFEAPVTDLWPPEHHTRILFKSALRDNDQEAYVREVLRRFISRAFRRPAAEPEVDRYLKIYEIVSAESESFEASMRETLAMVLISPKFLYHKTAGDDDAYRQFELASRMSYFLWGSMPDDELMMLAEEHKLDDSGVIEHQVRRLLADPRSRDFVDNFATQWLSIAKMQAVNINRDLFPRFLYLVHVGERRGQEVLFRPTIRDYMHIETTGFIAELIRRNAAVDSLIDSDFAYLNEPLAVHYGVEGVQGIRMRAVPLVPEHRLGGLLTHGSVLVGNSTGAAPHPIYRAVWLREAILGDRVEEPPAEVPALSDSAGESADKAATIKDLLALHRQQESCKGCHARLDPWGIPFERYNAIGRFQPKVPAENVRVRGFNPNSDEDFAAYQQYLASVNTIEVDALTRVPDGTQINGMPELKDYLLRVRIDDIGKNLLHKLLGYSVGRELTYRDKIEAAELLDMVKGDGYRIQDMILVICQSKMFRNE